MTNQEQIIVVEDDHSMKHAIERLLEVGGFGARSFTCAESLLQSGIAPEAACFVFDIHLPGLSGLELCHLLSPSTRDVVGGPDPAHELGVHLVSRG